MKNSWLAVWLLVMAMVCGISPADSTLWGKPHKDRGKGHGHSEKAKREIRQEKSRHHVTPGRSRIYRPPVVGSIQKDARKYRYLYYPDAAMYYNRDTGRYFWLQDGSWVSGPTVPDWAHLRYLPRVDLELNYLTPFAEHPWVVESFPVDPVIVAAPGRGPPPHAPAWGHRRKFQYHYYPRANVYYNLTTRRYFWLEGDGWRVGIQIPPGVILDENDRTPLVLGSPYPY